MDAIQVISAFRPEGTNLYNTAAVRMLKIVVGEHIDEFGVRRNQSQNRMERNQSVAIHRHK